MPDFKTYSLRKIAGWVSNSVEVQIPVLQRGLVWKPKQVEFLWDSLLRRFPVGTFTLSETIPNEQNKTTDYLYDLMDGQQRFNAISLGYNQPDETSISVLWLDLEPEIPAESTRDYFIKVTTDAHPWGYKNDEECTRLNTSEKRSALQAFGMKGKNIYNEPISLSQTWPYYAKTPIPLYCFLNASTENEETFCDDVIRLAEASSFLKCKQIALENKRDSIKKLFSVFRSLEQYEIGCVVLPAEVLERERIKSSKKDEATSLEVLFTRLNTGGTRISLEDLNYSAIKAYWPEIKERNDKWAAKYMSPSKLAMLTFRLALTTPEDNYFKHVLSIKEIRAVSLKENEKQKVLDVYKKLPNILNRIDEWLDVTLSDDSRTPAVLRTSIAHNSPEVYLLFMYFAHEDLEGRLQIEPKYMKALAFTLHWLYANDKNNAVKAIFTRCKEKKKKKEEITIESIKHGISRAQHDCFVLHVYSSDEYKRLGQNYKSSPRFRAWKQLFNRVSWYGTNEAKEILLFAQRRYLNTHFSNYDPARVDLWESYNRPWDYDHIIPQEWIVGKRNKYRESCKQWLWAIGNIAAISFEINRGKGNRSNYTEYEKNKEALLFDIRTKELTNEITKDDAQSNLFAEVTFERMCKIYEVVYDVVKCLFEEPVLSPTLKERKDLMNKIQEFLPEAKAFFATDELEDLEVGELDWSREWIGVGVVKGNYYACFEWSACKKTSSELQQGIIPIGAEIGIRKAPNQYITGEMRNEFRKISCPKEYQCDDNPWWFARKDYTGVLNAEDIAKELKSLVEMIEKPVDS